jgi:phosphoribosylformylglycinamidine cyclo-ligase
MGKATYRDAGIDLEVYRESMSRLPSLMHRTFSPRVLRLDGGFAGLFQLDFANRLFARHYENPVLVSGTDGVGTKLKVAQLTGVHNSVGIDLVAMCVNDIICCGAEPLFFLDYIAMSHDDPDVLENIVEGISNGCLDADCALLGGETAIMPDLYKRGDYDLAGFCVGVVERSHLITGAAIAPGDIVLGISSAGIHSNGFSLVRKIVFEMAKLKVEDSVASLDAVVGQVLMTPTKIYARPLRRVLQHYKVKNVVHGIAHITGGGLHENVERILPDNVQVRIRKDAWTIPPVFAWLQQLGEVDEDEMFRVFNMGIGLTMIVSPYFADSICRMWQADGHDCVPIGHVAEGTGGVAWDEKQ